VLVAKATKIEDILAVQSRLDDVQGQIEQLSAQLKQLSNQADLSTLTVTLQPKAQPIQQASQPGIPARAPRTRSARCFRSVRPWPRSASGSQSWDSH